MTEQFAKLHKYCLDELLVSRGYKNQKLSRVIFTSDKMDAITFLFRDNAQFFVFYAKDSLSMVRLSEDYNVKQRLIPDGKPIYDEHYCDVLSCATGSNFVNKEEEFDKWEPFSKKFLDKIATEMVGLKPRKEVKPKVEKKVKKTEKPTEAKNEIKVEKEEQK